MFRRACTFAALIAIGACALRASAQPAPTPAATPAPQRATATPSARPVQPAPAPSSTANPSPTTRPAQSQAAQPAGADDAEALKAKVIEVEGTVEFALGDADAFDLKAWKPVTVDMELAPDTQIRTGMRSHCTLQFGEGPNITVIQLRRGTQAKILEYRRTIDEQRIRIGLGYGAVRGGSSEGTLRSDVVVDSTVATLAKRGTEGWEIEIEPVSGTFRISLSRSGLVEAFSKATGESQEVEPGEYVSDSTIARLWINQDIFDRAIEFYEPFSLTEYEVEFMFAETTGYSSLGNSGHELYGIASRRPQQLGVPTGGYPGVGTVVLQPAPVSRAEGNFGFGQTFRVLVGR